LPVGHEVLEARVRLARRAEADVLTHRPQPLAVHVAMDAAGVGILAGPPDVALEFGGPQVLGSVHRLDWNARVQSHVLHRFVSFISARPPTGISARLATGGAQPARVARAALPCPRAPRRAAGCSTGARRPRRSPS